jgi:hypothetical protein
MLPQRPQRLPRLHRATQQFLFLLVALLIKVEADKADNDSAMFNGVVGTLSLSLFIVPPVNKLIQIFSEDVDAGMDL